MRLGTEEWLDGAVRKAGKLFVKDLGRRSRSAARMMGGALSLRGSDTGGRAPPWLLLTSETDSPTAIPYRKLRHVAEEAPTERSSRGLSTDKMRETALMSHTNPEPDIHALPATPAYH
jgi:hypothetical protein